MSGAQLLKGLSAMAGGHSQDIEVHVILFSLLNINDIFFSRYNSVEIESNAVCWGS